MVKKVGQRKGRGGKGDISKENRNQKLVLDLAAINTVDSFLDRTQPNGRTNTPLSLLSTIIDEVMEEDDTLIRKRITLALERLVEEGSTLAFWVRGVIVSVEPLFLLDLDKDG